MVGEAPEPGGATNAKTGIASAAIGKRTRCVYTRDYHT